MKSKLAGAALGLVVATQSFGQVATAGTATPPVFVTGIQATIPDPNGKVPALNVVPGAGINTWSDGLALAVLTGGQYYEYCVSVASATAKGTGSITYAIMRGSTVIQSDTVVEKFKLGSQGVWYFCAGYHQLPVSPGSANLVATMTYKPKDGSKEKASLSIPVLLQ